MASGSGLSGSTAWHGAFRFRQYLKGAKQEGGEQPDGDLRELEFKKNQYGPLGETMVLRYRNGLFVPESGVSNLDKIARDAKSDEVFIDLVKRLSGEGRNVSDKPNSPTYAPASFAKETEAQQIGLRKATRSCHASPLRQPARFTSRATAARPALYAHRNPVGNHTVQLPCSLRATTVQPRAACVRASVTAYPYASGTLARHLHLAGRHRQDSSAPFRLPNFSKPESYAGARGLAGSLGPN